MYNGLDIYDENRDCNLIKPLKLVKHDLCCLTSVDTLSSCLPAAFLHVEIL